MRALPLCLKTPHPSRRQGDSESFLEIHCLQHRDTLKRRKAARKNFLHSLLKAQFLFHLKSYLESFLVLLFSFSIRFITSFKIGSIFSVISCRICTLPIPEAC